MCVFVFEVKKRIGENCEKKNAKKYKFNMLKFDEGSQNLKSKGSNLCPLKMLVHSNTWCIKYIRKTKYIVWPWKKKKKNQFPQFFNTRGPNAS